jgi:hypothetical protein
LIGQLTPALEHCRVLREIYVAGVSHWSAQQLAALDAAQVALVDQDELQAELERLKRLVGQQSTVPPDPEPWGASNAEIHSKAESLAELEELKSRVHLAISILEAVCR